MLDGQTDIQNNEQAYGQRDGWVDKQIYRMLNGQTDTDTHMGRRTNKHSYNQT